MGNDNVTTILIMAVLVMLSAYFSATETAFSSLNKTRLKALIEKGNKKAVLALKLSENYDKLISAILIGNNIVNIGLASIGTIFFVKHFGDIGATISTVVITIAVLIFGEISPKSIAKESPEKFAMFSAPIIRIVIFVLTPVNFLFTYWKILLSKLFNAGDDRKMTQDELLILVDEAANDGGINTHESELVKSAIEFNNNEAQDILTPRVDLEAVPVDMPLEEIAEIFTKTSYSRLPVYEETVDKIIGILHQKDIYEGKNLTHKTVRQLMKKPIFANPEMKINSLLTLLKKNKSHIAVITDEYGGTMGIVSMEDILEELVGEIWDEHDEVVVEIEKLAENKYKIIGSADLDNMFELLDITDDETDATTVNGWIISNMDKIPAQGETFVYKNKVFKVLKADERHVIEIEVTITEPETEEKED